MNIVPALLALLVSMAFTLYAVQHPETATVVALPVALLAVCLVAWSKRWQR